jgi:hypothetical protein
MRGYFGIGQLSASEKQDILNQHKSVYNGYQTMQPQVSNTQPLYVYDAAGDKEGFVVNNKGEVKKYTNMGINEQVETKEVCDECGSMIMDGVCECNYGHMEEELGEDDGPSFFDQAKDFVMSNPEILMALEEDSDEVCECGGSMYEGVCNECGSGYMEEETGHLDDIYDEEDLNPNAGFDYIEGPSNDVDTFEGMHKKLYESKKIHDSKLKSKIKNFIVKHSKIKNIETLIDDLSDDKLIEKIEGYAKMAKFSELNKVADDLFKQLKKSRKETNESDADEFVNYDDNMVDDDDFQDYESSYTQDGVDDPDNEDDGYEDLNASEVTDGELGEIDIADLVKGKKYRYNHPLHSDDIEYGDEHHYESGNPMYSFKKGDTGYLMGAKNIEDFISHIDDEELGSIEEQGGNVDDMDDDDVQPAYNFDSNGPGDVYPVNELDDDDMYSYEPMESAWSEDELEEGDIYGDPEFTEQDISGVQGIYGAMDRAYDFDSDGPGKGGPYQEFSYESKMDEDEDFDATEDDFNEVDEDLKESFLIQKNKITEMFNRFNRYN